MDNHFLTEIEIEKFKCFSNFKAEGFKRVNLIGGKNNVGKTAFMEACFINVASTSVDCLITALIDIKFMRENINLVYTPVSSNNHLDSTKYYYAVSNLKRIFYALVEGNAKKEYRLKLDHSNFSIHANELSIHLARETNIAFIDNFGWGDGNLNEAYKAIQTKDKEGELNIFVHEFDEYIESFKVIAGKSKFKFNGEYQDITELGDGTRHYVSIICGLYACENGYLFIDEIGNGIHYTQHDRLWELILTLSEKTNCQVFAITHSKEMLESFARVAKKLDEQDISYTTLVKNKQQEIKAITQDSEMLLYSLSQEHEVR